jgi:hypothetical protein
MEAMKASLTGINTWFMAYGNDVHVSTWQHFTHFTECVSTMQNERVHTGLVIIHFNDQWQYYMTVEQMELHTFNEWVFTKQVNLHFTECVHKVGE